MRATSGTATRISRPTRRRTCPDLYERPAATIWEYNADEAPVPLDLIEMIDACSTKYEQKLIRNDLPENQDSFSYCGAGLEAARALQKYRAETNNWSRVRPLLTLTTRVLNMARNYAYPNNAYREMIVRTQTWMTGRSHPSWTIWPLSINNPESRNGAIHTVWMTSKTQVPRALAANRTLFRASTTRCA
jgi:hypothetical protein